MNCPNCGLANPDNAKFCANCGTAFTAASGAWQTPYQQQPAQPYQAAATGRNSMAKNIGLGCLVVLLIFILFGLSCTRACFGRRRYYRRYAEVTCPLILPSASSPAHRDA